MKNLVILSFTLILTACGLNNGDDRPSPPPSIPTDFAPFINRFIALSEVNNNPTSVGSLVVRFDTTLVGSSILGVCRTGGGLPPEITINPSFWNSWAKKGQASSMEQLMFHELGHCLLYRPHRSDTTLSLDTNEEIELSIMNPYHLNRVYYEGNYNYYIQELFNPGISSNLYAQAANSFPISAYTSSIRQEFVAKASHFSEEMLDDEIHNFECGSSH